jgi:ABC-2 type transport system permease protein/oleandomycin transport system permease protein
MIGGDSIAGNRYMWAISDTWVIMRRNLLRYVRIPQLLIFSTVQPIMLLLLFNYVFGGAINTGGIEYIQLSRGIIDRFRSLPIARAAVLSGRTLADTARYTFLVILMLAVGTAMGFRFEGDMTAAIAAITSAFIGMSVKDVETAQVAGFVWVFPLVFASSMFVPVETMPGWLQAFAKVNPVTVTTDTVRALSLGLPLGASLWQSLAWIGGLLVIFSTLAVNRYRRMT